MQIISDLSQENLDLSIKQTMDLFDSKYPFTFNHVICGLIYSTFKSMRDNSDIYIMYLKAVQTKEEGLTHNIPKLLDQFGKYIVRFKEGESYYLFNEMIEQQLIDVKILKNIQSYYFLHLKTNIFDDDPLSKIVINNYDKLSENNWELHKKLIKEGINPNEIAKIIRNDEIEKLQEISSQDDFNFNQTIKPSLYERYSFINQENISLIDYAAFFCSIQCFKYLLMNGANVFNAGKYAITGGNIEIIHLSNKIIHHFKMLLKQQLNFKKMISYHK